MSYSEWSNSFFCPFKSCNAPIINTTHFTPSTRKEKYERDRILRNQRKKIERGKALGNSRQQKNLPSGAAPSYSPPTKLRRYNQATTSDPHHTSNDLPWPGRSVTHGYTHENSNITHRYTNRNETRFTNQSSVSGRCEYKYIHNFIQITYIVFVFKAFEPLRSLN